MGNIVGGQTEPAQVAIATCIAARLAASDSGAAAGRRDNSAIPISYLIVNEVVSNQIKVQIIIRNYFKQVGGLQNFAVFRNQQVHINVSLNDLDKQRKCGCSETGQPDDRLAAVCHGLQLPLEEGGAGGEEGGGLLHHHHRPVPGEEGAAAALLLLLLLPAWHGGPQLGPARTAALVQSAPLPL